MLQKTNVGKYHLQFFSGWNSPRLTIVHAPCQGLDGSLKNSIDLLKLCFVIYGWTALSPCSHCMEARCEQLSSVPRVCRKAKRNLIVIAFIFQFPCFVRIIQISIQKLNKEDIRCKSKRGSRNSFTNSILDLSGAVLFPSQSFHLVLARSRKYQKCWTNQSTDETIKCYSVVFRMIRMVRVLAFWCCVVCTSQNYLLSWFRNWTLSLHLMHFRSKRHGNSLWNITSYINQCSRLFLLQQRKARIQQNQFTSRQER